MIAQTDFMKKYSPKKVLIAAHRGSSAGNIPFNTLAAFDAALFQGADIIETDITRSANGELFIFHPKQEINHLNKDIHLEEMTMEEIGRERYVNFDNEPTECGLPSLEDALEHLKGRCLINLDHGWDDIPDMVRIIRRVGVEEQVIIKTPVKEKYLSVMEELAPDLMYIPIIKGEKDTVTELIEGRNINYMGAELVFSDDSAAIAQPEYIESHHRKGRILWVNSLIYNYKAQLSGGHSDDAAITGNAEYGWGWLIDRKFDIIQTDWVAALKSFIDNR